MSAAVAVILAVIARETGGDGWESNPPRTPQQRPADGFEDRGRHQSSFIPDLRNTYFGCHADKPGCDWRLSSATALDNTATVLKTAGGTSPRTSPARG